MQKKEMMNWTFSPVPSLQPERGGANLQRHSKNRWLQRPPGRNAPEERSSGCYELSDRVREDNQGQGAEVKPARDSQSTVGWTTQASMPQPEASISLNLCGVESTRTGTLPYSSCRALGSSSMHLGPFCLLCLPVTAKTQLEPDPTTKL